MLPLLPLGLGTLGGLLSTMRICSGASRDMAGIPGNKASVVGVVGFVELSFLGVGGVGRRGDKVGE